MKRKDTCIIHDGAAELPGAPQFSLESAYGSVKPFARPEDFDAASREAKDSKAEATVRDLRQAGDS